LPGLAALTQRLEAEGAFAHAAREAATAAATVAATAAGGNRGTAGGAGGAGGAGAAGGAGGAGLTLTEYGAWLGMAGHGASLLEAAALSEESIPRI